MVHRWRCRRCSYTVWSASREALVETVQSHLLDHHRHRLTKREFQVQWECPFCETTGQSHEENEGVQQFATHLFGHVEPLVESETHVANEINGTGGILVRTPPGSDGAENARVHFLSPGDIVLFITTTPAERIRHLRERLDEWPAWTIVLTTKENPLAGVEGIDLASAPLEVVRLDRRLGLSDLGETVSRVLDQQETDNGKVSVEFDILSEIIEKFDLQTVFRFLHLFGQRLENAGALAHYYVNPQARSTSTVNVLEELFDLSITANGQTFVSDPRADGR
jgi:hypothetical protein